MKILLLDVDGVVIRPRHKYFSEKYSEDYNIPLEEILPFFKGEYKQTATGRAKIEEALPPYLSKWGWKGSVEDFLQYWFEGERETDEKVLEVVRKLRSKGTKVYLVSDNEARRADYLMNEVGLDKEFDGGFFSSSLGVTKSDPEFFKKITNELNVNPSEIEYWDDDPKNTKVAGKIGINVKVYSSFEDFRNNLSSY